MSKENCCPVSHFTERGKRATMIHGRGRESQGQRILGLLDTEEEIPDTEHGQAPAACDGTVEFRSVQFGSACAAG